MPKESGRVLGASNHLHARFSEAMFLANLATWQKKRRIEERYKKDIALFWGELGSSCHTMRKNV
jgi:hypothetical protein